MSLAAPNYYTPGARNVPAMICDVNVDQLKCQSSANGDTRRRPVSPAAPMKAKAKSQNYQTNQSFVTAAHSRLAAANTYTLSALTNSGQQWARVAPVP